jgi:hypothetical protein
MTFDQFDRANRPPTTGATPPAEADPAPNLQQELAVTPESIALKGVLDTITSDPRYLQNVQEGKRRKGHPEGTIAAHIEELEVNLSEIVEFLQEQGTPLSEKEELSLKILVHTHDTFKCEAEKRVRIDDPKSHASIARAYLEQHLPDPDLLQMVQLHDVPWSLFQQNTRYGDYNEERFQEVMQAIDDQKVFQLFLVIDNCTAGKVKETKPCSTAWFIGEAAEQTDADIDLAAVASHIHGKALERKHELFHGGKKS